ncbi:MAG: GntR family transcriptional regulator [Solirubrobacterales bacterium]|nr:GntR family transcriptional regulator [Solirubrobacterales bacterium]
MSVAERAYVFAKERILDGRYTGGELISEGDVAAGVGVSRTPVREAFLRLETEGLLRLYPKRGALVVPVSAAEVESVMETRLLVEQFAVEKVIRSKTDLGSRPREAIARQEDLAACDDERNFVETDREFHRIFVAAARNPILLQLHDSLRDRQSRMMLAALARDADRLRQVLEEHRALVDAVEAGDAEAARSVLEMHLHVTLTLLRSASKLLEAK